ncbi:MAG TPA: aldo/keto reductase, partial [Mycobacteriales bacterium]|nr:aldo/keto reductase [Mycobacteriales bacterium]
MPDPAATAALAGSGRQVSRLSLGTGPLGNLYAPVPDDEAARLVEAALAAGLSYLDTAPHYGAGRAEQRLGLALRSVPRSAYLLSTKVGRLLRPRRPGEPGESAGFVDEPPYRRVWDFTAAGIRRSVEGSLARLGIDRVDVLYLHDPDDHEEDVYRTGYPALAALREQGVVGAIGAGMNQAEMLTRFVTRLDLDVVLLAGRYTLLEQGGLDSLLPACLARGVAVVIGAAFNSGVLADPRPGAAYDYLPAPEPLVRRAVALRDACAEHGTPVTAAALQFPLAHPAVRSVLTGPRSVAELEANVAAFRAQVP